MIGKHANVNFSNSKEHSLAEQVAIADNGPVISELLSAGLRLNDEPSSSLSNED